MTRYIILHNPNPSAEFYIEDLESISSDWCSCYVFDDLEKAKNRLKILGATGKYKIVKRIFEEIIID